MVGAFEQAVVVGDRQRGEIGWAGGALNRDVFGVGPVVAEQRVAGGLDARAGVAIADILVGEFVVIEHELAVRARRIQQQGVRRKGGLGRGCQRAGREAVVEIYV